MNSPKRLVDTYDNLTNYHSEALPTMQKLTALNFADFCNLPNKLPRNSCQISSYTVVKLLLIYRYFKSH